MPEIFVAREAPKTDKPKVKEPKKIPPSIKNGMLSAFMVRPNGIRFETQETEEEILLLMRRHLVTNVAWLFTAFVFSIAPTILVPILLNIHGLPKSLPPGYFAVLPIIWYLGIAGFILTNFLQWYYNIYIVTDKRIVDIDWISLLYKQLSSSQLNKIQDVTYRQKGIIDSFFDFGTVYIQTAGTEPNFEFEAVPKPEKVVRQINEIIEEK